MHLTAPHGLLILAGSFVAVLAVVVGAQAPKPGFADPVLGRWDLTVGTGPTAFPSWVDVQLRKETQLMGRFVGQFGSQRYLTQVDFANGDISFTVPVQYEAHKTDLVFKGKLAGDRLEGTTLDAEGKTLTWTGVRAPALHRDAAPPWGAPVTLFDGRDLSGWTLRDSDRGACWSVKDGLLVNTPPCRDLISERTFDDFKVHLEFRYPQGSNSGVYLRGRYELQIQDDAGKALSALRMGGVYGFLKPYVDAAGKPDEWQTYDVTLIGRRVTAVLNGKTVVDNEIIPGVTGGALDSNEGTPGPLLLQGDHGPVAFRNITVTPGR